MGRARVDRDSLFADWRALMSLSFSLAGDPGWTTTEHQGSVGGKSRLPNELATTWLRPGQVSPVLPSLLGCSEVASIGLWLILNKHFIAKPARATSSPRFVSDTIYELADF